MGVIVINANPSMCLIKTSSITSSISTNHGVNSLGWSTTNGGRKKSIVAMTSTLPTVHSVEPPVTELPQQVRLTGDSFIRPHLKKLSPYQAIFPFEV